MWQMPLDDESVNSSGTVAGHPEPLAAVRAAGAITGAMFIRNYR